MRKPIIVLITAFMIVPVGGPGGALAADNAEIEDLRREVRQLQAQIQALRTAITEATELDRQRASILLRALKGVSAEGPSSSPPKTDSPPPKVATSPPASSSSSQREERSSRRQPAPSPSPSAAEPSPGTIRGRVAVPKGEPVAYVYVENVLAPAVKGQKVTIEQTGKKFVPSWAVVQRGTTISFPNRDNIYHNVFSLSSGNSFDLGLYNSDGDPKTHTFTEPGAVDIYCNIHPQMAASALVVPNRHYAKVKADGSFEIAGVPPGRRKVVAWAPSSRLTVEWVDLAAGQTADVGFKLEPKAPGHKNKAGQAYGSYD